MLIHLYRWTVNLFILMTKFSIVIRASFSHDNDKKIYYHTYKSLSMILARFPSRQNSKDRSILIFNAEIGRENIVKRPFRRRENRRDWHSSKSSKINEMNVECRRRMWDRAQSFFLESLIGDRIFSSCSHFDRSVKGSWRICIDKTGDKNIDDVHINAPFLDD